MAQFWGVLALLLSETPVLQFNVTRYTIGLTQAMNSLKPNNATVLSMKNNCFNISNNETEILLQIHFKMLSMISV
jgi:hypothetical protein